MMKLLTLSLGVLPLLAPTLSSAMQAEGPNWETYVNDLGYTEVRFKEGMEPGSWDYDQRFGGNDTNAIRKRQNDIMTDPLVGSTKIPWGCEVNLGYGIIPRLYEVCRATGCDEGTSIRQTVKWSSQGLESEAAVILTARGRYPNGYLDPLIEALQAEVITEAVEFHERETRGGGNSPFNPIVINRCTVVEASNFYSVVTRTNDNALIGEINLSVQFDNGDPTGAICGTVANAAGTIVGIINGIAGGLFGLVQDLICN